MRASKPVPLRFGQNLRDLIDKMAQIHDTSTMTDYIAGLVVLDAYRSGKAEWLRDVAIPGWATEIILGLAKGGKTG